MGRIRHSKTWFQIQDCDDIYWHHVPRNPSLCGRLHRIQAERGGRDINEVDREKGGRDSREKGEGKRDRE